MAITRATNLAGLGTVFDALTDGGGLSISGVSTFTDLNVTRANVTGVSTFATLNITNSNPTQLNVTGLGTFSNGPVLIGSASSTGTASQPLQVTGGAYVSGNLGVGSTSPVEKLDVAGNIRVGVATTANYIAFRGTYLDDQSTTPYGFTYIGERLYGTAGQEKSELLLFKGNDGDYTNGPDRIRLAAAEIRFDTYSGVVDGSFEYVGSATTIITNRATITPTGDVGIGTDLPTGKAQIVVGDSTPGDGGNVFIISAGDGTSGNLTTKLNFGVSSSYNFGWIQAVKPGTNVRPLVLNPNGASVGVGNTNPQAKFHVSAGNIKVDNGYGIDFSATGGGTGTVSSSVLDDYEEGSFTPVLQGSTSNPTPTYNTTFTWGYYTRVGNVCHVAIEIRTSAVSGGSGDIRVAGLPFNATTVNSNIVNCECSVQVYNISFNTSYIYTAEVAGGTTFFVIRGGQSGSTGGNLQISDWATSGTVLIRITGHYIVL